MKTFLKTNVKLWEREGQGERGDGALGEISEGGVSASHPVPWETEGICGH